MLIASMVRSMVLDILINDEKYKLMVSSYTTEQCKVCKEVWKMILKCVAKSR